MTIEPAALVDAVYPLVAGAAGGVTLTVQGRNFRGNADAACVFGDVETVATLVSNNTITCGVPYTRRPGVVSFSVLISDVEIRQPDVTFRYVPQPEISGVSPEFGPESGNTLVTVFGAHLEGFYAECLFASAAPVPAEPISSSSLRCVTPPSPTGAGQIAVSVSVEDRISGSQVGFSYRPALRVHSLAPSAGTVDGGTVVTVVGEAFLRSEKIACRFGGVLVIAGEWVSDSNIRCRTPESDPGNRTVEVTSNGADFTNDGRVFAYLPRVALREVVPSSAPVSGGTRVTFSGDNLGIYTDLTCRFGSSILDPVSVSESEVVCETPSGRAGAVDARVPLPPET